MKELFRQFGVLALLSASVEVAGDVCDPQKLTYVGATSFGRAVSVFSETLVVSTPGTSLGGVIAIYSRQPEGWRLDQEWVDPSVLPDGRIGLSVSHAGGVLVSGAYGAAIAEVFEQDGSGVWSHAASLNCQDGEIDGIVSLCVAATDGSSVVVGAEYDHHPAETGAAYVFERVGPGQWQRVARLFASDARAGDYFGHAVAIDGDVLVVGAPELSNFQAGSAYVFERNASGAWLEVEKLWAPVTDLNAIGLSVGVYGETVLVGAPAATVDGGLKGAVYVYSRSHVGAWPLTQTLVPSDGEVADQFGWSVSLDGDWAVIGARNDSHADSIIAGSAYLFHRDGDGVWREKFKLVADDDHDYDQFGHAVAISGNQVVVGAWKDNEVGRDAGAAYAFEIGEDWDGNGEFDECECLGDLTCDDEVNLTDLVIQLAYFGETAGASYSQGNLDHDGDVDIFDLAKMLNLYGTLCP